MIFQNDFGDFLLRIFRNSRSLFISIKLHNFFFPAPDPPSNLTVSVRNGKTAIVYWAPPSQGNYSGFRLRVQSFSDAGNPRTSVIPADAVPYTLRDLTPGATYSLQLFTVLDAKESVAYTSRNFTTSKFSISQPDPNSQKKKSRVE